MKDITREFDIHSMGWSIFAYRKIEEALEFFSPGDLIRILDETTIAGFNANRKHQNDSTAFTRLPRNDTIIYLGHKVWKLGPLRRRRERVYGYFLCGEEILTADFFMLTLMNFEILERA